MRERPRGVPLTKSLQSSAWKWHCLLPHSLPFPSSGLRKFPIDLWMGQHYTDDTNSYIRWTSYPSISFWVPMMAGLLMTFSIAWIFVRNPKISTDWILSDILLSWVWLTILSTHTFSLPPRPLPQAPCSVVFPEPFFRYVGISMVPPTSDWINGLQMFATQMYKAMGPQWASSLLGFIALILMPIPFVLIK